MSASKRSKRNRSKAKKVDPVVFWGDPEKLPDIGSLDTAVLVGYPGSVASAWQQAGRAGRRSGTSVAVLVANSTPLNQFIARKLPRDKLVERHVSIQCANDPIAVLVRPRTNLIVVGGSFRVGVAGDVQPMPET